MKRYYSLFSGGVDSALATYKILVTTHGCHISPIFFDYGQKAARYEQEHSTKAVTILQSIASRTNSTVDSCQAFQFVPSDFLSWSDSDILSRANGKSNLDVENRNMILISLLVSIILADRKKTRASLRTKGQSGLIVGFKNEHYDTRMQYVSLFNQLLSKKPFFVSIVTPLISSHQRRSFHSLAKEFFSDDSCKQLVENAWSCYFPTPAGQQCGKCPPCKARRHLQNEMRKRTEFKGK